eukprot:GFUD01045305.1.p1 GENE.GFUD01045305.1~~GFUD01045305.1.p1  ORF type:complete len:884 (+),score=164.86 GFUD01045305.1:115-2766(+)
MAARKLYGAAVAVILLSSGLVKVNSSEDVPVIVCNTAELECRNGRCVPESWVCDGEDDCGDRTDEDNCDPEQMSTCDPEEFRCATGTCIPIAWQCDGEKDCPEQDALDEWDQLCQKERCNFGEFRCEAEGACIPGTWLCDDHLDCDDGSDEASCNVTCSSEEFQCLDRNCIQARWRCDGESDCFDGSDETNCDKTTCDALEEMTCDSGLCVNKRWRCDGEMDCDDGTDEKGCKQQINSTGECEEDSFACHNKEECINSGWICDGDADCADGSDEAEVTCEVKSNCKEDQFECKSGECIPSHLRCSKNIECLDGSDEQNCGMRTVFSPPATMCDPHSQFDCGARGTCVPQDRVCDRVNDCGNWEDEDSCHYDECQDNNGGCDHICTDTPGSFFCDCREGFRLSGNSTCIDIDECQAVLGSCSQICKNTVGSFECSCIDGFKQSRSNPNKCGVAKGKVGIIFAHQEDIRLLDISLQETSVIVKDTRSATVLDYHFTLNQVFWTGSAEKGIFRAEINKKDSERKVVVDGTIGAGDGIAVDWVYNNIYWTNGIRQTISVTDVDGSHIVDVVDEGLEKPRSVAVFPLGGWMFWSDWGDVPKIEKCGMDGSKRAVLATDNVMWPNGITLDLVTERVYWVDAKLHIIASVKFDGSSLLTITEQSSSLQHPFSVSIMEDWVYWTEWVQNGSSIFRANKFDGTELEKLTEARLHHKPMSLQVYHQLRQPTSTNLCLARPTKCSHICVPSPQILHPVSDQIEPLKDQETTTCLCPRDLVKSDDGARCVSKKIDKMEVFIQAEIDSDISEKGTKEELAEIVKEDGYDYHLLAVILGTVVAIILLAALSGTMLYKRHVNSASRNLKHPVPLSNAPQASNSPESESMLSPEQESSV